MPTAKTKQQIVIKVTNGGANDYVTIQNATQGWKTRVKLNAGGESLYNVASSANTCVAGDKIYVYANGRLRGNGSGEISGGGVKIEFTGTVDTISYGVNL